MRPPALVLHPRAWPPEARSVDDLLAVLTAGTRRGEEDDDPSSAFTQLEHALQCADLLQLTHPDDPELQVAGLLHDIGHLLAPGQVAAHGLVGRRWVEGLLGERIGALIELHVPAKRYLVTVDPAYRDRLSLGSLRTLGAQGDVLAPAEAAAFEADPHHRDAITLRRADEGAKVAGLDAGSVSGWRRTLDTIVAARSR
jgi:predicted HD phosphohydrolase